MNDHLDNYLCKKYPKIFSERDLPISESCMGWGLTCGDGWFHLIDGLCSDIQRHLDRPEYVPENIWYSVKLAISKLLPARFRYRMKVRYKAIPSRIPQVVALQVKEKFGTLHFYYSGGDDYIHGAISFAEYLSGKICERCGLMNEQIGSTTKGWIQTLCACCQPKNSDGERERDWRVSDPELSELWQKMYLEGKKKDLT